MPRWASSARKASPTVSELRISRPSRPERGQGGSLPDKEPEMAAVRAVGREGDQAAERGERDERAAAVEEPRIEAHFGDEAVEIGAEFDEDGVDRLHDTRDG